MVVVLVVVVVVVLAVVVVVVVVVVVIGAYNVHGQNILRPGISIWQYVVAEKFSGACKINLQLWKYTILHY